MNDDSKRIFTANDYAMLHDIVFDVKDDGGGPVPTWPGYRPEVVESPNGDGKLDTKKRFAHVAEKYLKQYLNSGHFRRHASSPVIAASYVARQPGNGTVGLTGTYERETANFLRTFLQKAHEKAIEVAVELGIPAAFWPDKEDGTLRILDYPHDAITNDHADFDLFTLMCYRNIPKHFEYVGTAPDEKSRSMNSQIHYGELMQELNPTRWPATMHRVTATEQLNVHQHSIVYFAMPKLDVKLPSGLTVRNWLEERKTRSRY